MTLVALATEDALSEAVGVRLIAEQEGRLRIGLRLGGRGNGYLRAKLGNFRQMARRQPVILFTDLDQAMCAPSLVRGWLGSVEPDAPNLLLRVAVREVEAWLLADHEAVRAGLSLPHATLPEAPDDLVDPKAHLLRLAQRAPRRVRNELLPAKGASASQGLGYNALLSGLVAEVWSPERAALRSDSLRRARSRLRELAQQVDRLIP